MQVFTINTPVVGILEKKWNGVSVPTAGATVDTPMVNVKIDKTKMERVWPDPVEYCGIKINAVVFKNPKNPKPNPKATKILGKPIIGNAILFSPSPDFNATWVENNGKTVKIMSWADVGKNLPAFIPLNKPDQPEEKFELSSEDDDSFDDNPGEYADDW